MGGDQLAYIDTTSERDVPKCSSYTTDIGVQVVILDDGFGLEIISRKAVNIDLTQGLWEKVMLLLNSK